jgi:cytoskeletal protein RodZ
MHCHSVITDYNLELPEKKRKEKKRKEKKRKEKKRKEKKQKEKSSHFFVNIFATVFFFFLITATRKNLSVQHMNIWRDNLYSLFKVILKDLLMCIS